jgi:putative tRNA adenosine deaminase-associated protein
MAGESAVDFAVAVSREEDRWQVTSLPPRVADDLHSLLAALRQQWGEGGVIGLVSVAEDFFVTARLTSAGVRLLLSDATAATEWPLARQVLDDLDLPVPDEDDERVQPVGDLAIFADLGMDAMELGALCDDLDLYPDEMLSGVAARLGFGEQFERAVDAALA